MKSGLICYIYKNNKFGDCSNGGISSEHDEVLLVLDEGGPFEENLDKRPSVMIIKRFINGRDYYHVKPCGIKGEDEEVTNGRCYMSGGCYIKTSDSRFPFDYPLSLHDRCESQEEYDLLSR